jgi:DNA-binding beta-propeller fold protein YncE
LVGPNIRLNTGMDFEPEYIAVDHSGKRAFVTLQEANAVAELDLTLNAFTQVVGLGAKDFGLAENAIDPKDNDGTVLFRQVAAKGFYMPDSIATYKWVGHDYLVMANEGDFREDNADRAAASSFGFTSPLDRLRVTNTDSSSVALFAAGARSFSIRDDGGNLVYDSGNILDTEANRRGIYDDGRSRDKGVEPEGVALLDVGGRTYAFVGLERTTTAAVAVFDISDPFDVNFLDMIVTPGDRSPEGLAVFKDAGQYYLAIANEVPGEGQTQTHTTLYRVDVIKQ